MAISFSLDHICEAVVMELAALLLVVHSKFGTAVLQYCSNAVLQ
jgi:hypothetical protein